jgi:hypothetical protein
MATRSEYGPLIRRGEGEPASDPGFPGRVTNSAIGIKS